VASVFAWECNNQAAGCTVKCSFGEMREHAPVCQYRVRPCFIHLENCSGVHHTVAGLCQHLRDQHNIEIDADESSIFSKAGLKLMVNRSDDYDTPQYNNTMLVRDEGLLYFICVMQMDSTNGICVIAMVIDDNPIVPSATKTLRVSIGDARGKRYTQCYPVIHVHELKGQSFDDLHFNRELIYIQDTLIAAVACPEAKCAEICVAIRHDDDM